MTGQEIVRVIGEKGFLYVEETLTIQVTVLDVKQAYGQLRYEVSPVAGTGRKWVAADRVRMLSGSSV